MIPPKYRDKIVMAKSDKLFDQEMKEIIGHRLAKGLDRRPVGRRIVERKMIKTPFWPQMKDYLKIAKFLPEDKSGQLFVTFNWLNVIVIAFLAVLLFAGLIYGMGLINTVMHNAGLANEVNSGLPGYANMTKAADDTFGKANDATQALRLVALTLIFSLILGTIFVNFLVKIHPIFFFLYVLILVLAVIFSAPVSNAYQNLLTSDIYGGILPSFTGVNYIMINLPAFVAVAGLLGGVFLFINIIRGPEEMGLR